VYRLVREKVPPFVKDRAFTDDIMAVQQMIKNNEIWETVAEYLDSDPIWEEF